MLESGLEQVEQEFIKNNEIGSLYNVSVATQVCHRISSFFLVLVDMYDH